MMFDWPTIIRQILFEQRVSMRKLSEVSGVSLSMLKRFLSGDVFLRSVDLDSLLKTLGYQLSFVEAGKADPRLSKTASRSKLIKAVGCRKGKDDAV